MRSVVVKPIRRASAVSVCTGPTSRRSMTTLAAITAAIAPSNTAISASSGNEDILFGASTATVTATLISSSSTFNPATRYRSGT
jgi:hypothetical protein